MSSRSGSSTLIRFIRNEPISSAPIARLAAAHASRWTRVGLPAWSDALAASRARASNLDE
eukprot:7407010-Pyramimonas_sp.AAC.1